MADFGCKARNILSFFDEIVNQIAHNGSKSAYLPCERLHIFYNILIILHLINFI